jgi:hypothetical protein
MVYNTVSCGFTDFIHRPKSKILKIQNSNHDVSEAGSASVLRWMDGKKRRTPTQLGPLDRASLLSRCSSLFPLNSPEDGSRVSFRNDMILIFNILLFGRYIKSTKPSPHNIIYLHFILFGTWEVNEHCTCPHHGGIYGEQKYSSTNSSPRR